MQRFNIEYHIFFNGSVMNRYCKWIVNDSKTRCGIDGMSDNCKKIYGSCTR